MIGLYAIVEGARAAGRGARGEELRIVRCGGLELVVGEAPAPLSEDSLRAHEATVRAIADASSACLPARFGAGASDEAELVRLLAADEPALQRALELVRGREQMTLRLQGVATASAASEARTGTRYLEERRRAQSVPELDPLRDALRDLIRAEQVERHPGGKGLLASVYHLIDRGAAAEYTRRVEQIPLGELSATVTGPWPAWAFAPGIAP